MASAEENAKMVQLDRKLWLTADRERVVEDGSAEAAFLLGGPGDEVPEEEAQRLGLKQSKPAANKQASAPENKSEAAEKPAKPTARTRKRAT